MSKDKVKHLEKRIEETSKQIDILLQQKINLMMLKREIHFKNLEDRMGKWLDDEII